LYAFWEARGPAGLWAAWRKAQQSQALRFDGRGENAGDRIVEAEARYAEGFWAIKLRVHDFDEAVDIRQVTETASGTSSWTARVWFGSPFEPGA